MLLVGVTGGIGTGKTTLAALLMERGAQVIDADQIGRDALKTGARAWRSVVNQFGEEVLIPGTMEIDRKLLARIVFDDKDKLAALNAIVHPEILARVADEMESLSKTDNVVVLDAALIVELGLENTLDVLVAVTAPDDVRTQRLARDRGMTEAEVAARIASQANPQRVIEKADIVVTNDGDVEALAEEADRLWAQLVAMKEGS